MLQSEFIERTHVYLTTEEFQQMHAEYNESTLDKDKFCKWWMKNRVEGATARMVNQISDLHYQVNSYNKRFAEALTARAYQHQAVVSQYERMVESLEATIAELQEKLARISHICSC